MADVSQFLSLYETTESLAEAKTALDQIAAMGYPKDLELGEYYDDLATVAAEYEDFALAAKAQQLAIEHGCRLSDLARDMLGWYLLKDGKRDEGEAVFTASVARRGDDPELHGTIGAARRDAGDLEGALRAFNRAVELAEGAAFSASDKRHRDRSQVRRLRANARNVEMSSACPLTKPGSPGSQVLAFPKPRHTRSPGSRGRRSRGR